MQQYRVLSVVAGEFAGSLIDYEISVPVRVNRAGQFISHSLQHSVDTRRHRRSAVDTLEYRVPVAGASLHLRLEPSAHLLAPGVVVERRRQGSGRGRGNLSNSTRLSTDVGGRLCHFSGHVRGQPGSTVAISTCSGLVGRVHLLPDKEFSLNEIANRRLRYKCAENFLGCLTTTEFVDYIYSHKSKPRQRTKRQPRRRVQNSA